MGERKMQGEPYRNIRICVDSYQNGEMKGRFFHPALEGGSCSFSSLSRLLVEVENLLDESSFPQSFTARRTFQPVSDPLPAAAESGAGNGNVATFIVRILFRQHASWQGSVTWVENRGEQSFRSVLELVLLMDSALDGDRAA